MAEVLVTGATGFVGTHLIPRLAAKMHKVFAASSRSGDIASDATWKGFPDSEIVIHLAARTFVPDSWSDPEGFIRTNLQGTVCALNYCRERGARLIFISSYLYGVPERLPIPEDAPVQANNPYALSKKLAEDACRFFSDYFGVGVTILRPFNIYGPRQSNKFLIPSIVEQVIDGSQLRVKDLHPKRDFLYIDDLIDAFLRSIETPLRFDIFNIASGNSHSVSEVIDLIQGIAQKRLPVQSLEERRPQEVMDTRADISRARSILGWQPRWSLSAGCAKMIQEMNGPLS